MKQILCHDIDGKLHSVNANKLIFRPSVYGLLIDRRRILLLNQKSGYDFPGGGMEIFETIDQTLQREFWEETGIKIKKTRLIDCASSFFYSDYLKQYFNAILIYYLCKKIGGRLSRNNFDDREKKYALGPQWIELKNITKINFANPINSFKLINQAISYR